MKPPMNAKRAPERDPFAELSDGTTALAQVRQGKRSGIDAGDFSRVRDVDSRRISVAGFTGAIAV